LSDEEEADDEERDRPDQSGCLWDAAEAGGCCLIEAAAAATVFLALAALPAWFFLG
jgi:hypothetical protein